jgi:glycosyltransferase involved in cell wall biosynthesis/GT2 family glycosyltransferase
MPARPLRILVVHSELPLHDRHAGSLRLFRLVGLMAQAGHDVTFLARGGLGQERYQAQLLALGVRRVLPVDPERLAQRGQQVHQPAVDLAALGGEDGFDIAWLSFYELAEQYLPLLRARSPRTRILIDTVDVHWVREHRGAVLRGDAAAVAAAERTRERERAVYGAADGLIAVSDDDASALADLAPGVPVHVVSTVHDIERAVDGPAGRDGVIFVANFTHTPNVDGVLWFVERAWPLVLAECEDAHLWIVGTEPPEAVRALAGERVTVTGWVAEVEPFLDRARVTVAPLRYGAGVKGKIGQAIARGVPVVTTTIGAEGMGLVDGQDALIADEPAPFAAAVVRLLREDRLWVSLAECAQGRLEAHFGSAAASAALAGAFGCTEQAHRRARSTPRAALAVQLAIDAPTAERQLAAVLDAVPTGEVELVAVVSAFNPQACAQAQAAGARVVQTAGPPGQQLVRDAALAASAAPVIAFLGPLALPSPGFVGALCDALGDGASLAGAMIDGACGYAAAADGSLWPRQRADDRPLDALAFDCVAATREVWSQAPPRGGARDGHYELALARWAASVGSLAVATDAVVTRQRVAPVSVIVCTRDRAAELPDAIGLLAASGALSAGGEVLIVDSASSDATGAIAAELVQAFPAVRMIRVEEAGLSLARNAGALAARNELLCFLDDDARPAPGWLEHTAWALTRPGVVAAGGPVCALWPDSRPPDWPPGGLEMYLSVCERGDADRLLVPPDVLYGANWAIRREALSAVGGFPEEFGYAPGSAIGGEEVCVAWRLARAGTGTTLYTPLAGAGHRIDAERIDDRWLLTRALRGGIEQPRLRVAIEGADLARMLQAAEAAAAGVLPALPQAGELSLEEAFDAICGGAEALELRARRAHLLGELAATTLLLDESELMVGGLTLRMRPEHLYGQLARALAGAST